MRGSFWWIDRWRKSTAYTDLTLEEQGAYRNLLDELWLREGPLPDDDRILAKISGDATKWRKVKKAVLSHFYLTPDGWCNKTHDEVFAKAKVFFESQSAKGRKGAEKRWGKMDDSGNASANGPAIAPANDPGNASVVAGLIATDLRTPISVHRTPLSDLRSLISDSSSTTATNPFQTWEQSTGRPITPHESETIKDWEKNYGATLVCDAIKEAANLGVQKVNVRYIETVLLRWQTEGRKKDTNNQEDDPKKYLSTVVPIFCQTCGTSVTVDRRASEQYQIRGFIDRPCPNCKGEKRFVFEQRSEAQTAERGVK